MAAGREQFLQGGEHNSKIGIEILT